MQSVEDACHIFEQMVSMNTISSRSNLGLIDYVAELLEPSGFDLVLTKNSDQTKANLFASIGPDDQRGLILSGHSDVVPVSDTGWDTDPFKLTNKDNRFYGRGTCDMKGFLAIAVSIGKKIKAASLKRPLHLAISYDEEIGCLGAPKMLETLNPAYEKPAWAVIGEPTMLNPVHGHKSITVTKSTFKELAAHSSLPENGINAIQYASLFIQKLYQCKEAWASSPVSEKQERSINTGLITGGLAPNIVADFCEVIWDLRQSSSDHPEAVMNEVQELTWQLIEQAPRDLEIFHKTLVSVSGLSPDPDSSLADLLLRLTGSGSCQQVHYLTEAGLFQREGIDAIVCGPGSIDQAHQNNEYLDCKQFEQAVSLIENLIVEKCCKGD